MSKNHASGIIKKKEKKKNKKGKQEKKRQKYKIILKYSKIYWFFFFINVHSIEHLFRQNMHEKFAIAKSSTTQLMPEINSRLCLHHV